jgi:RsiW-degrading membrane proteinase PrsW (M82 family)
MWCKKLLLPLSVILAISLALSAFCSPAFAQWDDISVDQYLRPDAFVDGSLDAALLSAGNYSFADALSTLDLSFEVTGPRSSAIALYVAVYSGDEWLVLQELGMVPAGSTETVDCSLEVAYDGLPEEMSRIALIGATPGGSYLGKEFDIAGDWTAYESNLKLALFAVGGVSALVMLAALIAVMAGVFGVAVSTRHREVSEGEYTFRTLFFPLMKSRPLGEKIANVIISPFFWAFEVLLIGLMLLIILLLAFDSIPSEIGILAFLVGGVAAVFMPFIYLVIAWLADYYEREPFRFVFAMFLWGAMSVLPAFMLNTIISEVLGLTGLGALVTLAVAVLVAPVVEETSKGLGLLFVSGHHELDDVLDGMLYGFAIGLGFAAVENWLYFSANVNPATAGGLGGWAFIILYRSLLCSLAHGCFTGITGGVIGFLKSRQSLGKYACLGFFVGVPFAMLLHGTFNFLAMVDGLIEMFIGTPIGVFDPVLTLGVTGLYVAIGIYLQLGRRARLKKEQALMPVPIVK